MPKSDRGIFPLNERDGPKMTTSFADGSRNNRARFSSIHALFLMGSLLGSFTVFAAELAVEGEIDSTPSELRQLSVRANALEAKIRELEQRIRDTQRSALGPVNEELIDYRLELKPDKVNSASSSSDGAVVVSHVRMSMDGRPFIYAQSAIVVSDSMPLPLFMGKIPEGNHQIRLQFQTAPLAADTFSAKAAPWRTVDQVINLELTAAGGKQQTQTIAISDSLLRVPLVDSVKKDETKGEDTLPRIIDKMREAR